MTPTRNPRAETTEAAWGPCGPADRSPAVALSAPGRWTYVYGRLNPETDAPAILAGAGAYAGAADGIVPWRERPEIFRKQSLARIPPLEAP